MIFHRPTSSIHSDAFFVTSASRYAYSRRSAILVSRLASVVGRTSGVKRARIRAAVSDALASVGMARREARRPAELSGGEQQRVAIARALINRPSIILADEPTGNLDSRTGDSILDLLSDLNDRDGVTVLMVTHRSDAVSWGSRTIEMCDGQIRSAEREVIACRG